MHSQGGPPFSGMLSGHGADRVMVGTGQSVDGVQHFIGEASLVAAFVEWAGRHGHLGELPRLCERRARLPYAAALQLSRTVGQLRRLPPDDDEQGLALVVPRQPRTPMRGLVAFEPSVLLASSAGALMITADGLTLKSASVNGSAWRVSGWRVGTDQMHMRVSTGEVVVPSAGLAHLLLHAGHCADEIVVPRLPLRTIFTMLLMFLGNATRDAIHAHAGLAIEHVPSGR
jgi:hypothetical protein